MEEVVATINGLVWSKALVYLCLGTGIFFSVMTRFVQARMFREMLQLLFTGKESDAGISSFQAFSVSLSGRVGTGNIAGVAAAIGFGGPSAVFWMWVVAFLGASTAYVESTLGQIYKEVDDDQYRGGPAYYFEKALGQKWYAWVFAISAIIATGLLLPGVQSNSIGNAAEIAFGSGAIVTTFLGTIGTTKLATAATIGFVLGVIIFGGVKRIAHFTQVVVPFMALAYIGLALFVIIFNIADLPDVIALIMKDIFSPMALFGGAIFWGVKRGVYSNEAGQGTGPHAAAAAEVQHPAQQGLVQAFSVYIDTIFVCTATAFMILITGAYNVRPEGELMIISNLPAGTIIDSPAFTQFALESVVGPFGKVFIAVALFFFAFTTILAYYYIAETNLAYLQRTARLRIAMPILKVTLVVSVFYGTIRTASMAWALGDIGVGLLAWLNILGILLLFFMGRPTIKALSDYEAQLKIGVTNYTFDPKKLGIKNAKFWEK